MLVFLIVLSLIVLPATGSGQTSGVPIWRLEEELRIGGTDGPAGLTDFRSVVLTPGGTRIIVSQPRERSIKVLDARSGELLATAGRRGTGPGEFSYVGRVSLKGDSVVVEDRYQSRLVFFDTSGHHLQTIAIRPPPMTGTPAQIGPVAITPGPAVWAETRINATAAANGSLSDAPLLLVHRDGRVIAVAARRPVAGIYATAEFGGRVAVFRQPFAHDVLTDVAPDGSSAVVVFQRPSANADRAGFRVLRVGHAGDTLFDATYGYPPIPITDAIRDSVFDRFARMFGGEQGVGAALRAAERSIEVPERLPPVAYVLAGAAGASLVRMTDVGRARSTWMVLDPQGRHVADLLAPAGVLLVALREDTAWGVLHDELGVPYLVRYRVAKD